MRTSVLVGVMIGALLYMVSVMGLPGLVVWVGLIGVPVVWFGKRAAPTPEHRRRTATAYVLPQGGVLWNGRIISLAEAEKRGLHLEYPERPKRRKKSFFKSWRTE